jgi:hypothetical protein
LRSTIFLRPQIYQVYILLKAYGQERHKQLLSGERRDRNNNLPNLHEDKVSSSPIKSREKILTVLSSGRGSKPEY